MSRPLVKKQAIASLGFAIMGCPLTLNEVFITTGWPVSGLSSLRISQYLGLASFSTVCGLNSDNDVKGIYITLDLL